MSDWLSLDDGDGSVPGWAAWSVEVRLGTMPDGTVAPIGLRIEPRDDYDGSIRDQRVTLERLRQFPIGYVTAQAKYLAVRGEDSGLAEEAGSLDGTPTLEEILDHLRQGRGLDGSNQDWERVALLADAVVAKSEAFDALLASQRAKANEDLDAQVRQAYRDGGWSEREINLQRAADYYREALQLPEVVSPRKHVAESMSVSLTTVDRLLRQARTDGYLPPYDGPQGKHGKKKGKKGRAT